MASPSMDKITASIGRSLKSCSLNNNNNNGEGAAKGLSLPENYSALDLNSQVSLPYQWEQCLDLKTGKIFFINWQTGMKSDEDPRTTPVYEGDDYYCKDDSSEFDSEGSYSESSPPPSPTSRRCNNQVMNCYSQENSNIIDNSTNNNVLVVAGCKSCFMYYMVPKQQEICPKCCCAQLMHFDRSVNGSP